MSCMSAPPAYPALSSCWELSEVTSSLPAHSLSLSHTELRRCPPHSSRQCQLWTEGRNSLGTLVTAMWIPCSSFNHESEHHHGGLAAAQHYRCLKHSPCQGGVEHEIGLGVGVLYSAQRCDWAPSVGHRNHPQPRKSDIILYAELHKILPQW